MRALTLGVITIALLGTTGCPDKDKHESIELTNEGVEKFRSQSWDRAIELFEDAVQKYPENHTAWFSMGEAYAKQTEWDEAAKAYAEAVKHQSDDAMYHMRLGQSRYEAAKLKATDEETGHVGKLENLSQAEGPLQKAVELNPDLFRAHYYLGLIYRETDRPKKAAESFTRAATLNPSFGPPFVELGEIYIAWDKWDEAIRVLSQGVQHVLDPEYRTNVYYNLGFAYDMKSRMNETDEKAFLDKAIEAYSNALDERADNAEAKLMRGLAYARKGDKSKAEADLDAYIKRGAGEPFEQQEANKALFSLGITPPL